MEPKRYLTLDGMRGVAAVAVVYGHTWGLVSPACDVTCNVPSASLAVDMFFVLSGFVISLSYDQKLLQGMSFLTFVKRRLIRLYPLYLLGFGLGALPILWDVLHGRGWRAAAVEIGLGGLILPSPTWRTNPSLIPILSPAWSLFAELYLANIPYALFRRRMNDRVVTAIVALSFVGLLAVLAKYGTTGVGALWSGSPGLLARVGFSFFLGVLLQRVHLRLKVPSLPAWIVLAVTACSFFPRLHGLAAGAYEIACIALVYPALILLGAHSHRQESRISVILGDASYAVYVIHIPLLVLFWLNMPRLHITQSRGLAVAFAITMVILSVLLARYVDLPVRSWLTRRFGSRPGKLVAAQPM